jgi:hypothetical protein
MECGWGKVSLQEIENFVFQSRIPWRLQGGESMKAETSSYESKALGGLQTSSMVADINLCL